MNPQVNDVIIFDIGSYTSKVGLVGEDAPRKSFLTLVGRRRRKGRPPIMIGMPQRSAYVGDEALCKAGQMFISYPMSRGLVTDWDDMERVWYHAFYTELRVKPEEHFLILSEVVLIPKAQRERIAQVMFEVFGVPALLVVQQPLLALYSSKLSDGLIIDSGYNATSIVPFTG